MYTKITLDIPQLEEALAYIASTCEASAATQATMREKGIVVELDNGLKVWVASEIQDDPLTAQTDIITIAIALNDDGSVKLRASNVPLFRAFWHGVDPGTLVQRTIGSVRRDLMLMALGEEPEDSDEQDEIVRKQTRRRTAERSIRGAMEIVDMVTAPSEDVL